MTELLRLVSLPLLLTLGAFQLALLLQRKLKSPLCNPILVSVLLILGFLSFTGMRVADYQAGIGSISWLLTPATICLAIAFYEQFQEMKQQMGALCVGVVAGSVCCLGMLYILCHFFGFDRVLTLSLLPKSITNAIGVALSEEIGGIAAITTAAIAITGIFGNIAGPLMCRVFGLKNEVAQGVAFGTAAHVIGTAKATEMSQLAGAVGSLSLTLSGLITTVLISFVTQYI